VRPQAKPALLPCPYQTSVTVPCLRSPQMQETGTFRILSDLEALGCYDARSRAALKPATKRASVREVSPRGSITSTIENTPRT